VRCRQIGLLSPRCSNGTATGYSQGRSRRRGREGEQRIRALARTRGSTHPRYGSDEQTATACLEVSMKTVKKEIERVKIKAFKDQIAHNGDCSF
jgi:hypothetical protein